MNPQPKPTKKVKAKKRRKKTERQKLDEQILALWSKVVRARDGTCRNCNSDYRLQAHHIIQRTYKYGRYDTRNGLCLCSSCHFPEHVNPERFRDMIIEILGEGEFQERKAKYMMQYSWTIAELKEIKDDLKREMS